MERISSRCTWCCKWLAPGLGVAFVVVWAMRSISEGFATRDPMSFVFPAIMLLGTVFAFKTLGTMADEVLDEGECLFVRQLGTVERVQLADIATVRVGRRSRCVILTLRNPGKLGNEICFIPKVAPRLTGRDPLVDSLTTRIGRMRQKA